MKNLIIILGLLLLSMAIHSEDIRTLDTINGTQEVDTPQFLVTHDKPFYGLAFIYNQVQPIYMIDGEVVFIDPDSNTDIPEHVSHYGWKSRYQLAMVGQKDGVSARFENNRLIISSDQVTSVQTSVGYIDDFPAFHTLKYAHLWGWLKQISLGIEWLLSTINQWIGHWGWSIVVLSLVMKLLLMPISFMTLRFQRMVSKNQTLLAPKLADIKQRYKGEQAHNAMMAAHKELGITPFYTLKPMMTNLIQIPILVAIFNVLGEMSQLEGQPFLWVSDLSLPDTLFGLGFSIPLLGTGFNLLPFVMTLITLLSTVFYKNELAPDAETKKTKINLYLMAIAFFVLFYPFPAAMVLYWAMANLLQFIQQKLLGN